MKSKVILTQRQRQIAKSQKFGNISNLHESFLDRHTEMHASARKSLEIQVHSITGATLWNQKFVPWIKRV